MQRSSAASKTFSPVTVFGQTNTGRRRSTNEDNYLFVNFEHEPL